MSWQNTGIAKPVPNALASALGEAGSVISLLQPLLEAIKTLLQAAELFYHQTLDPFAALVQNILTQLQNLINDFFGAGVFNLIVDAVHRPGIVRYDTFGIPLMTPGNAIQTAIDSLDDTGDIARPQFSDEANIVGFGLMATAPDIDEFLALIALLRQIFTIPDWELIFKQLKRRRTVAQPSVPPDWRSVRLNSIQEMHDLQVTVNDFINLLKGYAVVPDTNIQDLVTIIDQKIAIMQRLMQQINQLITDLRNTTGIFVMNMPPGIGGNTRLKTFLQDCPLSRSHNGYTIMCLFVGGGPSLEPVNNLRNLVV